VQVEGTSRDLAPILRYDLYRISGEALRNAFLHGQATRIEVEIRYDTRQFRLRIRDNGKGIDPKVLESGARVVRRGCGENMDDRNWSPFAWRRGRADVAAIYWSCWID
jgi:signal transduction histidine kinase